MLAPPSYSIKNTSASCTNTFLDIPSLTTELAETTLFAPSMVSNIHSQLKTREEQEQYLDLLTAQWETQGLLPYLTPELRDTIISLTGNCPPAHERMNRPDTAGTPAKSREDLDKGMGRMGGGTGGGSLPVPSEWVLPEEYYASIQDLKNGILTKNTSKDKTILKPTIGAEGHFGIRTKGNHKGIDINFGSGPMDYGIPVYATHSGLATIKSFEDGDKGGNRIYIISGDEKIETRYMHLSKFELAGENGKITVSKGQKIGEIGSSAEGSLIHPTMSPHLHYEIIKHLDSKTKEYLNPEISNEKPYIEINNESLIDPSKL